VTTTGQVNRRFSDVTADGLVYCYFPTSMPTARESYFVQLSNSNVLTIEKVTLSAGQTPCTADPSTWAFTSAAVNFIR
jgi:hypothetical protein